MIFRWEGIPGYEHYFLLFPFPLQLLTEPNTTTMEPPHQPPPHLLEPYHYISSTPGKNIRSALIDCFQLWLRVPRTPQEDAASCAAAAAAATGSPAPTSNTDTLTEIKSIIASLHNASLLIDDIEDNSKLRRGNPVAHSIFGVANCINCANYVYFLGLEQCQRLGSEEALKVCICVNDVD